MNKLIALCTTLFIWVSSLSAVAQTDITVDDLNYSIQNGAATLTGRNSYNLEDIYIPATVNYEGVDYPVTAIAAYAFSGGVIDKYYHILPASHLRRRAMWKSSAGLPLTVPASAPHLLMSLPISVLG